MTDFAQAFQNDQNEIPSHNAKSHVVVFLMRLEEFIHKMHFHLPLLALTLFRTSQKPPVVI